MQVSGFRVATLVLVAAAFCPALRNAALAGESRGVRTVWPQWRGPARDGFSPGTAWPPSLSEAHLTRQWRVDLGPGYPGPIVAEDRVFVVETKDKKEEIVHALDRDTGRELWKSGWEGAMAVPFMARRNGDWVRSTPAYDGDALFVAGMRDVLVCLEARSGEIRWRIDFATQFSAPLPSFGFVSSPLVLGDHVYVQAGAAFCKVDKRSGRVMWRVLLDAGGMYDGAFSSPLPATIAGVRQLIVQTRRKLVGVDPEAGVTLWSRDIPATLGMNILTPTVNADCIFTSAYGAGSFLVSVTRADKVFSVKDVWATPVQGYMSTPVVIGGHAYLHLRNKRLSCVDLQNGAQQWSSKVLGEYCSLVARGDRILALDQRGELLLFRADPGKFDLMDSRKISDQETWGHLAVCDDQVFVRELRGIAAYVWR